MDGGASDGIYGAPYDHLLNQRIMPAISKALLQWQIDRGEQPRTIALSYDDEGGINVDLS